jgi:hypothetical protein
MKQNLINRRNLLRVAMAGTAAAMPSLKEFDETAGVNQLPVQEVEDQSLIYPAGTKR